MFLIGVDIAKREILFNHRTSGWYGRSSSLARDNDGGNIYLGGSYDATNSNRWDLAFIRFNAEATTSHVSRLIYKVNDCGTNSDTGYPDVADAPYISHMAFQADDGIQ